MEFRIADTFTDSLARLTGDEQKAVKTTAFDLQMNPAQPGHQFHRLDRAKDRNFWSVRVSADIRLIVHRTDKSLLLCYVARHDSAYSWAERRKIQVHPQTGAAQLVEVRETVREIVVPVFKPQEVPAAPKPLLFTDRTDEELLNYGVPVEWLPDIRKADEDSLLQIADRLPAEAAEALLELATGGLPRKPVPAAATVEPFEHPDAQRRFRTVANLEELQRALESPWDKWTVFLHPEQRECVERNYNGPARISGSAGTGKTIVALHRAVFLVRQHPESRILLATFSDTLAHALHTRLRRLIGNEPRLAERVDVSSLQAVGERLFRAHCGILVLAEPSFVQLAIREAGASVDDHKFSSSFLIAEWGHVVDAWNLTTWESYRDVARLGRKTRLQEAQRKVLWSIYEKVRDALRRAGSITHSQMFHTLAEALAKKRAVPYDYCIVDEAQDVGVDQMRFLAALGGDRPEALFFTGDLGQRIFQQPFSWKSLGVSQTGV
jgi:mRNA-degrading endonuclease RelE of RelBE toxin-antitoxin system